MTILLYIVASVILPVLNEQSQVVGSSFLISSGSVLTAEHVVKNSNVYLRCGANVISARVVRVDNKQDLALLRLSRPCLLPVTKITQTEVALGATVHALGCTDEMCTGSGPGYVANFGSLAGVRVLVSSAEVAPGYSGGVLVDISNEVVGVTHGYFTTAAGRRYSYYTSAPELRSFIGASP